MGKPRMIILIRHAQSEGNKNRDIHQMIPDHRVKLTDEGKRQALEAGNHLRSILRPDDNVQFFTSPYRRARETTEGILTSLTASDPEHGPSPFPRHTIKVFEEPRLREQDFGNFQPCSAEMERMWQERADYGHFFYRIPDGESAADAYDRVSGFNESLWRNFNEPDFPSVCVLVTHGLMTRVFLMKWYHWSVEYFEDLRNVNHCEFVVMRQNPSNGKYLLENKLRTWSELKRRAAANNPNATPKPLVPASPSVPVRKWGGCQDGCNHHNAHFPRRQDGDKQHMHDITLPPPAEQPTQSRTEDSKQEASTTDALPAINPATSANLVEITNSPILTTTTTNTTNDTGRVAKTNTLRLPTSSIQPFLTSPYGRDAGGSLSGAATPVDFHSGAATPADGLSDVESDGANNPYFHGANGPKSPINPSGFSGTKNAPTASGRGSLSGSGGQSSPEVVRKVPRRKHTEQELEAWVKESGMGSGKRADRLGDREDDGDDDGHEQDEEVEDPRQLEREEMMDKSIEGSVY